MSRTLGKVATVVVALLLAMCIGFSQELGAEEHEGASVEMRREAVLASEADVSTPLAQSRSIAGGALPALPPYFVENQGQLDQQVAYYVQGKDKTLYFTPQGVTFALSGQAPPVIARSVATTQSPALESRGLLICTCGADRRVPAGRDSRPERDAGVACGSQFAMTEEALASRWIVKLEFVGANPDVRPVGLDDTGAVISYFKGRPEEWVRGAKAYSGVLYRDLWPGIDLEYRGLVNQLKYQFVVHPGADPSQIRLAYHGATDVTIDEVGSMQVSTPVGGFQDDAPYAYQQAKGGEQLPVSVSYEFLSSSDEYGLRVGRYDPTLPLILDPTVLNYCGYLGGLGDEEYARGIAVDSSGNAYVTGNTDSTHTSFPVTVGPDPTYNGDTDAFVAKVRPDGRGLDYCGYIGGSAYDAAHGIAVDSSGHAYIAGDALSAETQGFPAAIGPYVVHSGSRDAFVAKVRPDGTDLVYCGYIGGSGVDSAGAIAVDSSGSAYVAGSTYSAPDEGFPVLVGPDLAYADSSDAFVAKVYTDGSGLVYCGYIGGSEYDSVNAIAVDSSGSAHVAGTTDSNPGAGFPVAVGPDVTHNGAEDGFVAKVQADGAGLDYCGYIGGDSNDTCSGIALDSSGNAYVVGSAWSDEVTFPVTVGPDVTYNGGMEGDAFVAKVRTGGAGLDYCGYVGGTQTDRGQAVAVDGEGRAHVAGNTHSSEGQGFPVVDGPKLTYAGGATDAFVARVASDGTHLDYCGYIGGGGGESCLGIALDGEGNAYVAGWTGSSEAVGFPVAMGPDLTFGGGTKDAFVARVGENRAPTLGVVVPDSGSSKTGVTVYFTTTWQDADGRQDLKQCYFHIGASPSLVNNVTLMYNARKNKLWLLDDAGTTWTGGFAPGSTKVLENSQAKVYCITTSVHGEGDTMAVSWAIEFQAVYTGAKKTGLKCKDAHKAKAKGKWKGTWLIY